MFRLCSGRSNGARIIRIKAIETPRTEPFRFESGSNRTKFQSGKRWNIMVMGGENGSNQARIKDQVEYSSNKVKKNESI
jgi:hypothetical protein